MKEFKTESKRMLDLMANSIYTNNDIAIRELISNASDALDKIRILALQNTEIDLGELSIKINIDKEKRLLTFEDNGIGMNEYDLETNLGTIAASGSSKFKNENQLQDDEIIGNFGVGFYSALMIADKITVLTKRYDTDKAYQFIASSEGFEISEANKETRGTSITLHLKANSDTKNYDKYLEDYEIKSLIKKYSDFIKYPIYLNAEKETINALKPIWKKAKSEISDEDYNKFYTENFYDFENPLAHLHFNLEGNPSYSALLYIPSKAPSNFYNQDYDQNLNLYAKSVFIKKNAKELVNEGYRFIRGIVDSNDLNLNISRELLQDDHQLELLRKSISKKINSFLLKLMKDKREDYEKFFNEFGLGLKFACYNNFGINKDEYLDLLLFKTSKEDKYRSLSEYIDAKEDKKIYYASGKDIDSIKKLPQFKKLTEKNYEILYFTDPTDDFFADFIKSYKEFEFENITKITNKEDEESNKEVTDQNKDLLSKIKDILKDECSDVKISSSLDNYASYLVANGPVSIEMEKMFAHMKDRNIKADKILELNPDHKLFKLMQDADDVKLEKLAKLALAQAKLLVGLELTNPFDLVDNINSLI